MFDVKKLIEDAESEVQAEMLSAAKAQIKAKLRERFRGSFV